MTTVSTQAKRFTLDRLLLTCWYLTVFSAPFGDCLLRIALPIGGHFFLFRGMILLTCFVYLLYLLRRRENPLCGLFKPERRSVILAVCMLVYGLVSVLWASSVGAWFSKLFTMCQMFAMTFLFLKLCRDSKVMRNTMWIMGITVLITALGGLAELWHGPYFDTPYRDYSYVFFDKAFYAPIFTYYNPNGLSVYLLFTLECLVLYMAHNWNTPTSVQNKRLLWAFAAGMCLTLFLSCADAGRLSILSIPVILLGLAVWLLLRYKKGLLVFAALALTLSFVYVGENYLQVKYQAEQTAIEIRQLFEKPGQPTPEQPVPDDPTPPPQEKNPHGTLYTLTPSAKDTAAYESLSQSDGVRVTLLKDSVQMICESHGLGIGLSNVEPRLREMDNTGGLYSVHCFVMEVLAEFGIFALIPLLAVGLSILRALWLEFYAALRARDKKRMAMPLLLFFTAIAYAPLSTANSSSWGIQAMWFYLAMLLLYSGQLTEEISDNFVTAKNG